MYSFYALEKTSYDNYLRFRSDLTLLRATATPETIEKVKSETLQFIDQSNQLNNMFFVDDDGSAHVLITGQLAEKPEICASLFGIDQTLYGSIIKAISAVEKDESVNKIILDIDSPGGTVSGVDAAAMAIRNSSKPTEAHVHNMAASAAFWLASQAGKIVAMTPTVEVGSIGVVVEVTDRSEEDEKRGIKTHTITSTDAPDKRVDISTEGGRDKIQARLDEIHTVFVQRVSEGRGVSGDKVNEDFGQGGVVIADKALTAGMIDEVLNSSQQPVEGKINIENEGSDEPLLNTIKTEVISMTKQELFAENPDLYKEITGEAVKEERQRVTRLLGWDANEKQKAVAKQAIIEGKSQDDVLSQLNAVATVADVDKSVQDFSAANDKNSVVDADVSSDITPSVEDIKKYV